MLHELNDKLLIDPAIIAKSLYLQTLKEATNTFYIRTKTFTWKEVTLRKINNKKEHFLEHLLHLSD